MPQHCLKAKENSAQGSLYDLLSSLKHTDAICFSLTHGAVTGMFLLVPFFSLMENCWPEQELQGAPRTLKMKAVESTDQQH